MISANIGVAVITIVLRSLFDRFFNNIAPVAARSLLPNGSGIAFFSATVYLLYNQLVKGRQLQIAYHTDSSPRSKHFRGKIERHRPFFSFRNRGWFGRRSSSRSRDNLLHIARESMEMLRGGDPTCSSCSSSTQLHRPQLIDFTNPFTTNRTNCSKLEELGAPSERRERDHHHQQQPKKRARIRRKSIYTYKSPTWAVGADKGKEKGKSKAGDAKMGKQRALREKLPKSVVSKTRSGRPYNKS